MIPLKNCRSPAGNAFAAVRYPIQSAEVPLRNDITKPSHQALYHRVPAHLEAVFLASVCLYTRQRIDGFLPSRNKVIFPVAGEVVDVPADQVRWQVSEFFVPDFARRYQ